MTLCWRRNLDYVTPVGHIRHRTPCTGYSRRSRRPTAHACLDRRCTCATWITVIRTAVSLSIKLRLARSGSFTYQIRNN